MPPVNADNKQPALGREYWRSLDDFVDSPDFRKYVENEFPSLLDDVITPTNRRTFLKLMGASLALAGAGIGGCRRWPDAKIAPFAHRPENYVPGEPLSFATAIELGGFGQGVLVKSFDGRPIKIEGNEKHPINGGEVVFIPGTDPMPVGATDSFTQAQILEFYDPWRSRTPLRRPNPDESPSEFAAMQDPYEGSGAWLREHFAKLRGQGGRGVAILHEATGSPTFHALKARLAESMPQARWHEWEPISRDNELAGAAAAFGGRAYRPHYDLTKADVIVALDSDFLMSHPASVKLARDFASRRRHPDRTMSRLYTAEATLSVTGSNADHRLRVQSRDIAAVAAAIAKKLGEHGADVLGAAGLRTSDTAAWNEFAEAVASDLAATRDHGGHSLIIAGPRQPAEVHALVHAINFALGNVGQTVNLTQEPDQSRPPHAMSIAAIAEACRGGHVETLIIIGGNPVYDAPGDVGFSKAIVGVPARIHLSLYDDETSQRCHWHMNRAHALESWSDVRAWDGTVSLVQPLIDPLYDGMTAIELLAMMDGHEADPMELVREHFEHSIGSTDVEAAWRTALHDGVVAESAFLIDNEAVRMQPGAWVGSLQKLIDRPAGEHEIEVVFASSPSVYDGRFANNGWLQELPHPIAKLCWDNAALTSPATAERLDLKNEQIALIDFPGARSDEDPLELPVHIVPGHADDSITINLGYGRTRAGHIGTGVGQNVYPWRKLGGMHFVNGARVSRTGRTYALATVQDHFALRSEVTLAREQDRLATVVKDGRLDEYLEHGAEAFHHEHIPPVVSLWEWNALDAKHAWGMAIDLSACTGCSACIIACQAENNVPIVGKDQVRRGREMHWIRVDRYYKGRSAANPEMAFQPVTCQHCENAPCEQVCPVAATVHDKEGLNVMIYNRCVGTRYCSNNCPYKVRRFNFYDWWIEDPRQPGLKPPTIAMPDEAHDEAFDGQNQPLQMVMNPDVTVRSRGVMEKCSFCVQRINRAKIEAKNEWVKVGGTESGSDQYSIPDGTITPACAQACPSQALIFGDLRDPKSRVSHFFSRSNRRYELLKELNTQTRTRYLAKVRNYNNSLKPRAGSGGASEEQKHH